MWYISTSYPQAFYSKWISPELQTNKYKLDNAGVRFLDWHRLPTALRRFTISTLCIAALLAVTVVYPDDSAEEVMIGDAASLYGAFHTTYGSGEQDEGGYSHKDTRSDKLVCPKTDLSTNPLRARQAKSRYWRATVWGETKSKEDFGLSNNRNVSICIDFIFSLWHLYQYGLVV